MVTQHKAQSTNFGPMWPEVTGFGAGPNKQIFCVLTAGQNIKNSRSVATDALLADLRKLAKPFKNKS